MTDDRAKYVKQDVKEEKDIGEEKLQAEAELVDTDECGEAEFDLADYMRQYKELEAACETARAATEDAEAKLLRLQADFDNYRRRKRLENEEIVKQASAGLVQELLPVLDNFERALQVMDGTPEKEGVEMIYQQFRQVLQNAGLSVMEAEDTDFDPNLHQAIGQLDAEKEEDKGKVLSVMQKGYLFNGKMLRAAMVQVGK